ncbi:GHMP kinase [Alkaliphilus metalliredigens QYMF]|uniref:GHMP kinase n=1 Tax=Alkaliphilus metalliredigens (strain QYMF) TaxID=293826 RepID=A6TJE3_ALKMQ|nr:GHMP kinase [Alkaliphilus metalliredigens]ABR46311.1 GHMP kinase [Alkaliphilus metalliredigens QYMF]
MIEVICPGSCGELIQGMIQGSEKLISYAINCYSKVTLTEGRSPFLENWSKSQQMIEKVLLYYGYSPKEGEEIGITVDSQIPMGKGMASSTADLAATALAMATYLNETITQEEIAILCVEIEPTDSTVFSQLTLFDHLEGKYKKSYEEPMKANVLMLEGVGSINTIGFRKSNHHRLLKEKESELKEALHFFEKGIKGGDLKLMGKAATLSAFANQEILYKKELETLFKISEKLGAAGVNVAHSGTVMGILYEENQFDLEAMKVLLKQERFRPYYPANKTYEIIQGGPRVITK